MGKEITFLKRKNNFYTETPLLQKFDFNENYFTRTNPPHLKGLSEYFFLMII